MVNGRRQITATLTESVDHGLKGSGGPLATTPDVFDNFRH
jgi:hypothetical protein